MTEEEFNKQFIKLYAYMDKRFDKLDAELEKKADKTEVDGIYTKLDGIAASIDDLGTEYGAIKTQLDRHEDWHHQVADHLGLTLQQEA